jgi:septal ring factor EnvC (AmiA/AmiB activator)
LQKASSQKQWEEALNAMASRDITLQVSFCLIKKVMTAKEGAESLLKESETLCKSQKKEIESLASQLSAKNQGILSDKIENEELQRQNNSLLTELRNTFESLNSNKKIVETSKSTENEYLREMDKLSAKVKVFKLFILGL